MDDAKICIHCFISGAVQGVCFRANTKIEADKLGLTGWIRNLSDGRVEALVCGPKEKVQTLKAWLAHGPKKASVTGNVCEEVSYQDFNGFDVN